MCPKVTEKRNKKPLNGLFMYTVTVPLFVSLNRMDISQAGWTRCLNRQEKNGIIWLHRK